MPADKSSEIKLTEEEIKNLTSPGNITWRKSQVVMTEEEVDKYRNMNWEWYYNCYILLDSPTPIACKRCNHINIFLPGEMTRKCENCGIECKRCEKEEKLGGDAGTTG